MCPVIFLDFDGVIGVSETLDKSNSSEWWSKDCGAQLQRILDETGAKIIISSSWRMMGLDTCFNVLQLAGIKNPADYVIGETPKTIKDIPRGDEIKLWLDGQSVNHDNFAIIDDDTRGMKQFTNNFFRTRFQNGLTKEIADRVINWLNKDQKNSQSD